MLWVVTQLIERVREIKNTRYAGGVKVLFWCLPRANGASMESTSRVSEFRKCDGREMRGRRTKYFKKVRFS